MVNEKILLGKLMASSYRKKILQALAEATMIPSKLSDVTHLNRTHVSRFLKELQNDGLVRCDTQELRKGKLYSITELGQTILKKLNEAKSSNE